MGPTILPLNVLAMFINGIIASKSTHTRQVAKKTPVAAKVTSREKQLSRWYQNERVTYELHMLPFVKTLLAGLAEQTLTVVLDGSEVGRHCLCLMVSVIYQKRAIPLLWVVVSGCKGHFPAATHVEVLLRLRQWRPASASVVVLGDGEFDSVELQTFFADMGWDYVCRTARNTQVCLEGAWLSLADITIWPGQRLLLAACLAYIWMIYLGTLCRQQGWHRVIHRTDRCDLSLFQLGLDLLDYFENEGKRIFVDFKPCRVPLPIKTVRQ